MKASIPQIDGSWRAIAASIRVPTHEDGWITEIDFEAPSGLRRIRFTTSETYVPIHDFLYGFDSVAIKDQNSGGANCIEYGRYLVEVFVDDDTTRFVADKIVEVKDNA